jgi:hypothetical protein
MVFLKAHSRVSSFGVEPSSDTGRPAYASVSDDEMWLYSPVPPAKFGTTAHPVGMHSPGFIADTDEEAKEIFYRRYKVICNRIGVLRGWPPG